MSPVNNSMLWLNDLHTFARFFWKLVIQISLSSWSLKKKKQQKLHTHTHIYTHTHAYTHIHTHTHTHPHTCLFSLWPIVLCFLQRFLYSTSSVIPQGSSLPIPFLGILFPGYTNNITLSTPKCLWLTTLFLKNAFLELEPILSTTYLTSPNWMPKSSSLQHFQ